MSPAWLAGIAIGSGWWLTRPSIGAAVGRRDVGRLLPPSRTSGIGAAQKPAKSGSSAFVVAVMAMGAGGIAYAAGGLLVAFAAASAAAFVTLRLATSGVVRRVLVRAPRNRQPPVGDARALPASLDLLAACLSAGAAPAQALEAVGGAFDGDVGVMLTAVARLVLLGAPVETAWSACLADARWAAVARAVIRAHYSGAALTDVLVHLADDRRRALRADAQAAAQRASIRAVLPLGACFLPAFVLVGVVPVVAGFARALWS